MYLCIDYGERYVGLAATDSDGMICYRYAVLDQKQVNVLDAIKNIVVKERSKIVLVGVPTGLSGNETAQTKVTRDFFQKLRAVLPAEITMAEVDETLTSVEAAKQIKLEGAPKEQEHAEAACIMLESYMRSHG